MILHVCIDCSSKVEEEKLQLVETYQTLAQLNDNLEDRAVRQNEYILV